MNKPENMLFIFKGHGSCNGLLPDGTKPLAEPMLTYHQQGLSRSSAGMILTEKVNYISVA